MDGMQILKIRYEDTRAFMGKVVAQSKVITGCISILRAV